MENKPLLTICMLGRMGDIVSCEPLFRFLKARYPERKLRWYTKEVFAELLRYSPDVDEVVCVKNEAGYLELKKSLPADTVSFELNFRNPAEARKKEKSSRTPEERINTPSLLAGFAAQAGVSVPDETPRFYFRPELKVEALPERYAVFHCFSDGRSRNWHPAQWRMVAQQFLDAGYDVIEIGINPVLKLEHPAFHDMTGRQDLQKLAKIIQQAKALVGVESGFGHIANAVGTFAVIVTGSHHDQPCYLLYSGRFRRGESCNLVRFYDVPSEFMPPEIVLAVVRRFLDGNPMSADECKIFCLTEQVRQMQCSWFFRVKRRLLKPFYKLRTALEFHNIRHQKR